MKRLERYTELLGTLGVDWGLVARSSPLVVDLRNAVPDEAPHIWRL